MGTSFSFKSSFLWHGKSRLPHQVTSLECYYFITHVRKCVIGTTAMVGLQCVSVVFPDHTHLLFNMFSPFHSRYKYEGCSNMNASSLKTFFTYMLQQHAIPFRKELFVAFKKAPNIKTHSLYFSSYRPLYKGHSCILKFFFKQSAMHVLVHVRI